MINKCPGQDERNIKAEPIKCASCGYLAEIFSDEARVRCPGCKGFIFKDRLPSCVDWCKGAGECIGETRWKQLKGGK